MARRRKTPVAGLQDVQDKVLRDYFTLDEAARAVQEVFPAWKFSKRQIARAVDSGKVEVESLGRLRYIHASVLARFMNRLVPTGTMPDKLRYSGYVDPAQGVLGQEGRLMDEDGQALLRLRESWEQAEAPEPGVSGEGRQERELAPF